MPRHAFRIAAGGPVKAAAVEAVRPSRPKPGLVCESGCASPLRPLGLALPCLLLSRPIIRFQRQLIEVGLVTILLVFGARDGDVVAVVINLRRSVGGTEQSSRHIFLLLSAENSTAARRFPLLPFVIPEEKSGPEPAPSLSGQMPPDAHPRRVTLKAKVDCDRRRSR